MELTLDKELNEIPNEGCVDGPPLAMLRPDFGRLFVAFVLEQFLIEKLGGSLRNLTQR